MHQRRFKTTITPHRVASPSGSISARVIHPTRLRGLAPLLVLHGISRNAKELVALFQPEAERSGRIVIVPHFSARRWPSFQRPCHAARPDDALLALLSHLAAIDPDCAGRIDLFGHSGGAQLAHRFAMLYPHRVAQLHLAAAGWYCLPDTSMAHPYGLGADARPASLTWARRHNRALPAYLRLCVRVYVGTADQNRDEALRQDPELDRIQGPTRIARAETYVDRFRTAALARGISPDITLTCLPGIGHDVAQAIRDGGLAAWVTAGATPARAATSRLAAAPSLAAAL